MWQRDQEMIRVGLFLQNDRNVFGPFAREGS
jgi:hypothetical protein